MNSSELNLLKILRESSESVVVEKRSKPGTFKALRLRASKSMSEKNGCLLNSDNPSGTHANTIFRNVREKLFY